MAKQIRTWLTAATLAVGLMGAAACSGGGSSDDALSSTDDTTATATADVGAEATAAPPEPDVADVPEVVAEVNGEEITREEFVALYESQFQQVAAQGQAPVDQDALKVQTLDSMIGTVLLVQAADDRDIRPTTEEVDATLEDLATAYGLGSGEEFLALLQDQGMSEEEARAEVESQVKVDTLLAEEADVEEPSEEELQALYDTLVEQSGGAESEAPPFEEVREQLAAQLTQQVEADAVDALVEALRADADVTVNL
jgi:peptidyl-prolyl cis-trans isomerase SurA